ncbi:MAG: SDR family oxidoreductase [Cyclobacteriaceae bacterium]
MIEKKTAVVTGGTKGIGRAIVNIFLENGFEVFTCARSQQDLEALLKESNSSNLHVLQADMSDKIQVKLFATFVLGKVSHVDVLVNNTGRFVPGTIQEEEEGTLEELMSTNVYSAYYLSRGLMESIKRSTKGHIFNICSTASITAYTNGGSYCITKFAMYGMSKVLREELKTDGVRVTSILPGATLTASWEGVDLPADRFMKPEDVAETVWGSYNLSAHSVIEDVLIRPQLGDL